jgi:hypothetical protein
MENIFANLTNYTDNYTETRPAHNEQFCRVNSPLAYIFDGDRVILGYFSQMVCVCCGAVHEDLGFIPRKIVSREEFEEMQSKCRVIEF